MSFFVIAAVLFWQAAHVNRDFPVEQRNRRYALYVAGAGMSLVLGVAGVRVRHRRRG